MEKVNIPDDNSPNSFEGIDDPISRPEMLSELFVFKEGDLNGSWKSVENKSNGGVVEVESFLSLQPESLGKIVFIPGMPGDSVGWMKERYLMDLLEAGYDMDLIRHCGLKVIPENQKYVSNESRMTRGGVIGKEKARMKDWFDEIVVLIKNLEEAGDGEITIISHSLGSLAVAVALLGGESYKKSKIKKWVNLSGATATVEEVENPEFMKNLRWYIEQFVSPRYDFDANYDPANDILEKSRELSLLLKSDKNLGDTRLISVYPEKDNLINITAGKNVHSSLETGLLINDESVKDEEYGEILAKDPFAIHDFPHLKSSTFLRLLEMKVSKSPHKVTVKN
jgi:pimeloyl-ACP methyl ester carboxylesterase